MYEIIWKRKSRHGLATIIRAHRVMGQGATDDDEDDGRGGGEDG